MGTVQRQRDSRANTERSDRAKVVGSRVVGDAQGVSPLERRRSFRVDMTADAVLWRGGHFAGRYHLDDLSIGGCRVSEGPEHALGHAVEVLIRVPHHGALSLPATVVRRSAGDGGSRLGLSFAAPSATAEDWIHDVVLWALQAQVPDAPHTCLVLMRDPTQAEQLVHVLRQVGRTSLSASTPLDAVRILVERANSLDVVFLDEQIGQGAGVELAQFMADHYPDVHRVMVGEQHQLESLSEAHHCGIADCIVTLPVDRRELERALQSLGCWLPVSAPLVPLS